MVFEFFIWTQLHSYCRSVCHLWNVALQGDWNVLVRIYHKRVLLVSEDTLQTLWPPDVPPLYELTLSALSPSVPCNKWLRLWVAPMNLRWCSRLQKFFFSRDFLFCFSIVKANSVHRGIRLMTCGPLVTASLSWPSLTPFQLLLLVVSSTHSESDRSSGPGFVV